MDKTGLQTARAGGFFLCPRPRGVFHMQGALSCTFPFHSRTPCPRQRWAYHNKPMDTLKVQMGLEQLGFMEPRADDIYVSHRFRPAVRGHGGLPEDQRSRGGRHRQSGRPHPPGHEPGAHGVKCTATGEAADRPAPSRPRTPPSGTRTSGTSGCWAGAPIPATSRSSWPRPLLSKNGEAAAPEVADLLGQIYARNPDMGRKARAELAGVVDEASMGRPGRRGGNPVRGPGTAAAAPRNRSRQLLKLSETRNETSTLPIANR